MRRLWIWVPLPVIGLFTRAALPDHAARCPLLAFLLAFTMSLDDFVITHFVPREPGLDTLSTKIYTEVKKGIKPEMYALSTLLFVLPCCCSFCLSNHRTETQKTSLTRRKQAAHRQEDVTN